MIDTGVWALACARLDASLRQAGAASAGQGWSLRADRITWSGWPAAAELTLDHPVITAAFPSGLEWRAEQARLRLTPLRPTTLLVPIDGRQSIAGRSLPPVSFTTRSTVIEAELTGAKPPLVAIRELAAAWQGRRITVGQASVELPYGGAGLSARSIGLPGISPDIASLALHLQIAPVPLPSATAQDSARQWRDAGGRVTVSDGALAWGSMSATGQATITLDPMLQPAMQGRVQVTDLPALLTALAASGTLVAAQADAAKAVLAVLGGPAGNAALTLPVTLDGGVLRIARFPLLRLSPLAWD